MTKVIYTAKELDNIKTMLLWSINDGQRKMLKGFSKLVFYYTKPWPIKSYCKAPLYYLFAKKIRYLNLKVNQALSKWLAAALSKYAITSPRVGKIRVPSFINQGKNYATIY